MAATTPWPSPGPDNNSRLDPDSPYFQAAAREAVEALIASEDLENRRWIATRRWGWGCAAAVWALALQMITSGVDRAVPYGVLTALVFGVIVGKTASIGASEAVIQRSKQRRQTDTVD